MLLIWYSRFDINFKSNGMYVKFDLNWYVHVVLFVEYFGSNTRFDLSFGSVVVKIYLFRELYPNVGLTRMKTCSQRNFPNP